MDRQGFDPLAHSLREVVDFLEQIEISEQPDKENKTSNPAQKSNDNSQKSKGKSYKSSSSNTCSVAESTV